MEIWSCSAVSTRKQLLGWRAAREERRRFNHVHSDGSKCRDLYLPAVDNYWARSTPVALVNLSAMKEERKDGEQDRGRSCCLSIAFTKQHPASRGG